MKCPYCMKVCTRCKRLLIAYNGNFAKKKNGKYGLTSRCKECNKLYYEENREEISEKQKQYYEEHREERLEYSEQYYEKHKEEISEYHKQYYEEHKEEISEKSKIYREDNKEEILQYQQQYYEEHKEEIKEKRKQHYEDNPYVKFNNYAKRKQIEKEQGKGITKEQWYEMMEFFDWKCAYSGISLTKDNRSVDHIIPLNKNGEHEIWNCVPMYINYNPSKGIKDMEEWYKQQPYYSEERLIKIYIWKKYAYEKWGK